jgi:hypothetical protein
LVPSMMQPRAIVKPPIPGAIFAAPRSLTAGKTAAATGSKKSKAPAPVFATLGGGQASVVVETFKVINVRPCAPMPPHFIHAWYTNAGLGAQGQALRVAGAQ